MSSVTLSEIAFAFKKNRTNLNELIRAEFEPIWFEKLSTDPTRAKSFTGNFAVTFHFQGTTSGGSTKDFGIRLWHSKIHEHDLERYRKLGPEIDRLNKNSQNYIRFAPMRLLEPKEYGFLVKGTRLACLQMEWQNAQNLDVFIERIAKDKKMTKEEKSAAFREIKQKLLETGALLRTHRCSHGDLSSGNIMISQKEDGSFIIHIVDFDSFYSHSLSMLQPSSLGHPDWQHPAYIGKRIDLYGLEADYCPLLCLVITLEALATEIHLYDQFSPPSPDGSGILIRQKDLVSPTTSPVLREIEDLGNPLLTASLDELKTLLACREKSKMKCPPILLNLNANSPAPIIRRKVEIIQATVKKQASWNIRKKIESEKDLVDALDNGATQMAILKAMANKSFERKFNKKTIFRFYETIIQHYGGIEKCEEELQAQYVWSMKRSGNTTGALSIAFRLFDDNPGNPHIGFMVFQDLAKSRKWNELLAKTTLSLDLQPTNININWFHGLASFHTKKDITIEEAFGDARVRTNDHWQLLCNILGSRDLNSTFHTEYLEDLISVLMHHSESNEFKRAIQNRDKIKNFSNAILEFLIKASRTKNFLSLMTKIKPNILRFMNDLPNDWEKTVEKILPKMEKSNEFRLAPTRPIHEFSLVAEILCLLCIWGRGEPSPKLAEQIQLMVHELEWKTIDNCTIGLSFDVIKSGGDPLIVYNQSNWTMYNDRTQRWAGDFGNIWSRD